MRQALKMPNNFFSANTTENGLNMPNYDVNVLQHLLMPNHLKRPFGIKKSNLASHAVADNT